MTKISYLQLYQLRFRGNSSYLSQKLSDVVASGYVTTKNGKFIKVADTPTWVHHDLRVKGG